LYWCIARRKLPPLQKPDGILNGPPAAPCSTRLSPPMTKIDPRRSQQFMQLLTRHQSQVFGYLYALVRNLEDTDDLYQQTTLLLWKKFDEFQPGSNFAAWACSVARFEALNFLQQKRRSRLIFDEDVILALADVDFDPAPAVEARQEALDKCLAKLNGSDRQLLQQVYGDDAQIKVVAARIGRPIQSVYTALCRIRQALFACIQRTLAV